MTGGQGIEIESKFAANRDGRVAADDTCAQESRAVIDGDVARARAAVDIQIGSAIDGDVTRACAAIDDQVAAIGIYRGGSRISVGAGEDPSAGAGFGDGGDVGAGAVDDGAA